MISMCGNCSAKVVSVMDGQRPQIRCEGRWRAPYIAARYGAAGGGDRGMVSVEVWRAVYGIKSGVRRRRWGHRVLVTGSGSWRTYVLGSGFRCDFCISIYSGHAKCDTSPKTRNRL